MILIEMCSHASEKCVIRALCNSGTTSMFILKDHVLCAALHSPKKQQRTRWDTMGGGFKTKEKRLV
jgi:hypothetical protein